jgi:hypothetical protein
LLLYCPLRNLRLLRLRLYCLLRSRRLLLLWLLPELRLPTVTVGWLLLHCPLRNRGRLLLTRLYLLLLLLTWRDSLTVGLKLLRTAIKRRARRRRRLLGDNLSLHYSSGRLNRGRRCRSGDAPLHWRHGKIALNFRVPNLLLVDPNGGGCDGTCIHESVV